MKIRKAVIRDFPRVLEIYKSAREFMAQNGNFTQWGTSYPYPEMIKEDINIGRLYVAECQGIVEGVFLLESGPDETYLEIEGEWLNNEPYYVIHRIASSGVAKGVLKAAVEYALKFSDNIRIDTHNKNIPMQKALVKLGFKYCGIIYVYPDWEGKSPRMAYHLKT